MNKIIFLVVPFASLDSLSKSVLKCIFLLIEILQDQVIIDLKWIIIMYSNRRAIIREDANIKEFAEKKEAIMVQFYGIHYKEIVLESKDSY